MITVMVDVLPFMQGILCYIMNLQNSTLNCISTKNAKRTSRECQSAQQQDKSRRSRFRFQFPQTMTYSFCYSPSYLNRNEMYFEG